MQDFFQIYDENFNNIPLPKDELGYGLRGLDLNLSSISQIAIERSLVGVPGNVTTGFIDNDRNMSLQASLKVRDAVDYRLKRDQVFAFFRRIGTFYVTESQQRNKLMKVRVVDPYTFQRPANIRTFATVEIPLKIIGKPYWISRFKSMDLHDNKGIQTNGNWSFGMGVDVNADKLVYQYTDQSTFNIYNAGTVPLKTIQEKGNCTITIEINQTVSNFKLFDETGKYFEYNPTQKESWVLSSGDRIVLDGHEIRLNGTPILERTNRYFLQLLASDNFIKMEGLTSFTITFDFRFKYD